MASEQFDDAENLLTNTMASHPNDPYLQRLKTQLQVERDSKQKELTKEKEELDQRLIDSSLESEISTKEITQ